MGLTKYWTDSCLYIFQNGEKLIVLVVYVDYIKMSEDNEKQVQMIIDELL